VPGVSISRYNMVGNYGGGDGGAVFVRGHGSGRPGGELSTMVDGIPRFNGFWTHPLMDLMSLDVADHIEVQKSPRPVTNGNMSFGAVNVLTRRMDQQGTVTRVNTSLGSHATVLGRLSHGGHQGRLDYLLVASHRQSDGHRTNADGETESLYAKVGYRIDEQWDLSVLANKTEGWAHDPQPVGAPVKPVAERYETDNEFYLADLSYRGAAVEGRLKAYYEDGYADWRQWDEEADPPEQENGISDYANYGMRASVTLAAPGGAELLLGLDLDRYGGSFVSNHTSGPGEEIDEELTNVAPWAMVSRTFGRNTRITPSAGLRLNRSSEFGTQLGIQAGAVAQWRHSTVHAAYARAFNLPGVYAAIFYGQYWSFAYEGDEWKDLDPEWVDHVEAGLSHPVTERLRLDLTWYRDEVTDALRIVPPPPPPPRIANIGEYTTQGLEASAQYSPATDLQLFAGGALTSTSPKDTPNAPDLSLSVGLGYTLARSWRLNLDAEYVGDQYVQATRSAQPDARVDGYSLANLRLGHLRAMGPGLGELYLAVENLLDEEYEHRVGYPMPGRTFAAGIDLRL
jgi:iron complex outermembrane receptor protein